MFVKATPYEDDPRPVSDTHNLYTVEELKGLKDDKERVDAYYKKRADLHDVLMATVGTNDPNAAYPRLEGKEDLRLLKKAIEEFYPDTVRQIQTPAALPTEVSREGRQGIQTEAGISNQSSPEDILSMDALRPKFGGGVQPQGYLLMPASIGVGQ